MVNDGITRRAVLALVPGTLAARTHTKKTKPLPRVGGFVRFTDPTTETTVVRLTNPATTSILPAPTNRFVSLRDRFLIFSSDATGSLSPHRVDLHTGMVTRLASAKKLDPRSLSMDEKERLLYFLDGGRLRAVNLRTRREERPVAEGVSAFSAWYARGSEKPDFWVVREGKLESLGGESGRVLADNVSGDCLARPGRKGCVFLRNAGPEQREIWYTGADTPRQEPVRLASGRVSNAVWSVDGQAVFFLREVPGRGAYLSEIHQVNPANGMETCISPTSAFAAFSANGDDSVFVGASRSKAQPNVILLLREVRREFTLCEHRASNPAAVVPVFSPDSRRVYFQSDHYGKPAIYSVNVELLVEPTPAVAA